MPYKSRSELLALYGDLLQEDDDPRMVRFIRELDLAYTSANPPARLSDTAPGAHPELHVGRLRRDPRAGWRFASILLIAAVFLGLAAGVALAVGSLTNLGRPANVLPPNANFPLSGFRRVGAAPPHARRATVLFLGTLIDDQSSVERWAVVKALAQFGNLSNVQPVDGRCGIAPVGPAKGLTVCGVPTYDWEHARYRSPYVNFLQHDLIDVNRREHLRLTPLESRYFQKYVAVPGESKEHSVEQALNADSGSTGRRLPLLLVGDFVQTSSQFLNTGDLSTTVPTPSYRGADIPGYRSGLPFAQVQRALVTGKNPAHNTSLNQDVNAEANVIVALICHAEGGRPASACDRAAIERITRHISGAVASPLTGSDATLSASEPTAALWKP